MGYKSEESQALLAPREVVASQTAVAVAADDATAERDWDGACYQVCGPQCDSTGVSSCALAYLMPCVAFGMNSKRALQGSFWLYAALYVFFFILWRLVVNAANWNMYIQCGVFKDETASVDRHRKLLDGSNKPLFQDQSPECQASIAGLLGAELLMLVFVVAGVVYAARRRTLIRRKLGIAGCWVKDLALWWFCGPCALCQETRTLATYNVEGGVWHGPTRFVVPMDAPAPKQAMMA